MTVKSDTIWGHPKGLFLLSSVEMWERFSFYAVQTLLVLFLTSQTTREGFGWSNGDALRLLGLYAGLVYATPVIGGWIADRFLGPRRCILIGACMMAMGHFLMTGPAVIPYAFNLSLQIPVSEILQAANIPFGHLFVDAGMQTAIDRQADLFATSGDQAPIYAAHASFAYLLVSWSFYGALALIIIGNGFFKPNISTTVGNLYDNNSSKRDSGFTFFWIGINIGALLANLVAGAIGETFGWHYGFGIAGLGMLIGMIIYLAMHKKLLGHIEEKFGRVNRQKNPRSKLTTIERNRIKAIGVMAFFAMIFEIFYLQIFGLLNLFSFQETDRGFLGFEIPATWIIALNPFIIILIAPLVALGWTRLGRSGKDPSSPTKFALALFLLGTAFIFMVAASLEAAGSGKASLVWLVFTILFISLAEIPLQPIGLSLVSRLSPSHLTGLIMGAWFMSAAAGGWLSGQVGALSETVGSQGVFIGAAGGCLAAAVMLFLLKGLVIRWMHDAETA
jgi:proton-dependent oligopeptide transporter, POT family